MARATNLKKRPANFDYRAQLEARAPKGRGALLIEMAYAGMTGSMPAKPYAVKDSVALICISGCLVNEACWSDETQYDWIQDDIGMALEDSEVAGILLMICSPGGETDNAFETADMIAQAGKKKPVWAAANPYAYSAAYLLGSQAEQFYIPAITGGVGSIGVYCLHMDHSEMLKQAGVKPTFISAGKGKTDGNPLEPLSADAEANMQMQVDRLYGEFVSRVASGRSMSKSAIVKLGAALFEGSKAALGAGLVDRAGSYETAWLEMGAQVAARRSGAASAAANKLPKGEAMEIKPAAGQTENTAPPPVDLVALKAEAHSAGYAQATEVLELCSLANALAPGTVTTEIATGFIREKKSLKDVQAALIEARAKKSADNGTPKPGEIRNGVEHHDAAGAEKPAKSMKQLQTEKMKREGRIS